MRSGSIIRWPGRRGWAVLATFALVLTIASSMPVAHAQWPAGTPAAQSTPFNGFDDTNGPNGSTTDGGEGAVQLTEKPFSQLSDTRIDPLGQVALSMRPQAWKHGETPHFILHYRRVTEALKVAREVEFDLAFVAHVLGANEQAYAGKSQVFIFQDDLEWQDFLDKTHKPDWIGSFARGDELYLNLRSTTPGTPAFDSRVLAHETTHAVVARIYPGQRWPLWLNEGVAEYMAGASLAARKNQTIKLHEHALNFASMSLDTLQQMQVYPDDPVQVAELYETAEKLIRYIATELPKPRFTQFLQAVAGGATLKDALMKVYPDQIASYDDFLKKYQKFTK